MDERALETLAGAVGLAPYEARRRLGSGAAMIARRSEDRAALEQASAEIRTLGHGAAVVSEAEMGALDYPLACRAARIERGRIAFLDAEGRTLAAMSPCRSALLVAACPGLPPSRPLSFEIARHAAAPDPEARRGDTIENRLARLFTIGLERVVVDLSWDECADRVRIAAARFRFESLGDLAGPSVAGNMRTLVGAILGLAENPTIDLGPGAIEPPRVIQLGERHDDRAIERPRDRDEESFERYARFLHVAWRGGLFDADAAAARTNEARSKALESGALPVGAAPHRVPTARTTRDARSLMASPAGEISIELPALRASSVLTHAAADLLRRARRLGPPAAVLPLAIGAVAAGTAAILGRAASAGGFALLAAGALALTHSAALFSRKREIENIPTSRIRSAAIGLCELNGKARAIRPMTTPFSLMPCVYYEFRVVSREDAGGGRTQVTTGSSGEVPFLLEDETGSVEVDPRGAIVQVSSRQTFHRPPFAESMVTSGAIVSVEETYIPEGHPIYVLGELRQIVPDPAHESEEFAAGDGRSDRLVIGRPESRDLFCISERSEAKTIAAFGRRSLACLALGIALILIALLLGGGGCARG